MNNPYKILNVVPNASNEDIKHAYRKLVLKYHPDKNKDADSNKFIEIQAAYDILSNHEKRKKYDSLSFLEQINYYDELKNIITIKYPKINDYVSSFIKNFYDNDETQFKNDLENFNFSSVITNFIKKIPNIILKKEKNIYGKITASLADRYTNKYNCLLITRETREPITVYVPLTNDVHVIYQEGESYDNEYGDIIINIEIYDIYKNFSKIKNDLYVELEVSLYSYLYGGIIEFMNLDDNIIKYTHLGLLENNIIKINNKGFIKNDDEDDRGDMYIVCKIKNLDNMKNKIKEYFNE